jgi:hypothetical protein
MLRWFHALLPREERFFDLFARHSEMVAAGATALRAMLEGGDAVPVHYKTVMDREQDADNITRDVLIAVRRSFITPFDRGDVKDLITSLDNAIDQMQKTAKTIMLFDQRAFTPQQREMADAIVAAAALVQEAIPKSSQRSRGARTSCMTSGCRSFTGPTCRRTRWRSSSESRSTTTSRRWSTASTTWATRSTVSCSRTCSDAPVSGGAMWEPS